MEAFEKYFPQKRLADSRGFTLLEILVATGLMGGLALFMAEMVTQSNKAQNSVKTSSSFQNTVSIAKMLVNSGQCINVLNSVNGASYDGSADLSVSQLYMTDGTTRFLAPGDKFPGYSINLNLAAPRGIQIDLTSVPPVVTATSKTYFTNLTINGTKTAGTYAGSPSLTSTGKSNSGATVGIGLSVVTDASTGKITDCMGASGLGSAADKAAICSALGGQYDTNLNPPCVFASIGVASSPASVDGTNFPATSVVPVNGIFSQGNLVSMGKVGIGTSAPTEQLYIANNVNSPLRALLKNSANGVSATAEFYAVTDDPTNGLKIGVGSSATSTWQLGKSGASFIASMGAYPLQFGTTNLERMRIDPTGNVGIGTTAPTSPLHVSGNFNGGPTGQVMFESSGTEAGLSMKKSGGVGPRQYSVKTGSGSTSDSNFRIVDESAGAADRIVVMPSGNVGIGITTPTYLLHVNGTAYASGAAGALSDVRHKKSIEDLGDDTLERMLQLRPVEFEWREPKDQGMQGTQTGFIAQEVQKLFPGLVLTGNDSEKTLGLKYNELIAVVVKSVKDFYRKWSNDSQDVHKELDSVKHVVAQANARAAKLEAENMRIAAENAEIKTYLCAKEPSAAFCK